MGSKMRRIVIWALLFVALPVAAATGTQRIYAARLWSESQALTRAAPTLATEGWEVAPSQRGPSVGYSVVIQAPTGQTLSGAGTVEAWVYDSTFGWHRYGDTTLDVTSLAGCTGLQTCEFTGFQIFGPYPGGRMLYAAKGVTISSGSAVTVAIKGVADLAQTVN